MKFCRVLQRQFIHSARGSDYLRLNITGWSRITLMYSTRRIQLLSANTRSTNGNLSARQFHKIAKGSISDLQSGLSAQLHYAQSSLKSCIWNSVFLSLVFFLVLFNYLKIMRNYQNIIFKIVGTVKKLNR